MPIDWRSSAETLARLLHSHGAGADDIADVETAWQAFSEFLQVEIAGLDPDPDSDADGFIVQWGRYSWNHRRPSLTFARQLAVVVESCDHPDRQPELWQVNLEMLFDDSPDLVGIDALPRQDTGFDFAPIGPKRRAAVAELRTALARNPPLQAAWRATPVTSELTLDRAD
jgi:hypothetical protein